jgi:phosphoribosylanthranilate isomerase
MALKTQVKVGNISNLSDARYCAGMGVDMLGFTVIEGQPHYIPPKLYQDLRGWVAGPAFIAELYGMKSTEGLQSILEDYKPDFLEVGITELQNIPASVQQHLIVRIENTNDLDTIKTFMEKIRYVIVDETNKDVIQHISKHIPVIVSLQTVSGLHLLDTSDVKGIALSGSPEIRPGYKDYGDLADVLEQLEID